MNVSLFAPQSEKIKLVMSYSCNCDKQLQETVTIYYVKLESRNYESREL